MIALTWLMRLWQGGPMLLATVIGAGLTWAFARFAHKQEEKRMAQDVAQALSKNHAVEQKESAAVTDGEADAALDAASDALDHS